jgi:large repetitive protein
MQRFSWSRWLRSLFRPQTTPYRKAKRHLSMEQLETRLAPAAFSWTGALALQTGNKDWSAAGNWSTNVAPTGAFDDLIFPIGPTGAALSTINDLPLISGAPPVFNSITIFGSGYTLGGNALTLGNSAIPGSGSITVGSSALNETISLNVQLNGAPGNQQFITVGRTSTLTISGHLSGTTGSQLTKEGVGTLTLSGDNSGFTGQVTIDNNAGIVAITTPTALGAVGGVTSVGVGSQLQVSSVTGNINENLLLNGSGIKNDGALLNAAGNNNWIGNIELDSDSTIGGSAGTSIHLAGQISDLGAGHNLTKEGLGQIFLDGSNTYRGMTIINNGILTIENAKALGASGTAQNGTVVNSNASEQGTLQINALTAGGFTVLNEFLTISGEGNNIGTSANPLFLGSLDSSFGTNVWTGPVALADPGPAIGYTAPPINSAQPTNDNYIGVDADPSGNPTRLTISGVVSSPTGTFGFTKIGFGRLVFTSANTYFGQTALYQGYLQITDSNALGSGLANVDVGASLELAVDNLPDSVTGTTNTLKVSNEIFLGGEGAPNAAGTGNEGALDSVSGINVWSGLVGLDEPVPTPGTTPFEDTIGVEPDPHASVGNSYFTNDYSLTVTGLIFNGAQFATTAGVFGQDTTFGKVGFGQLILPNANTYTGPTDIQQGWVTIENNNALGNPAGAVQTITGLIPQVFLNQAVSTLTNDPATLSGPLSAASLSPTTVEAGASLQLKAPAGSTLTIPNNLILAGPGITHPSLLLNQEGALINLSGNNTITGTIQLNGIAGIGDQTSVSEVQNVNVGGISVTGGTFTLTFNGQTTAALSYNASASAVQTALDNLSSIGGIGGSVAVSLVTTTNPPLSVYTVTFGGQLGGINVPAMTANGSSLTGSSPSVTVATVTDGGPLGPSGLSELTLTGTMSDFNATTPGGITKLGSGRVNLQGDGTYTGPVDVAEGVLRVQNNTALGTSEGTGPGGTTVESGASLELASGVSQNNGGVQAGIEIFSNHLTLNGSGDSAFDDGALTNVAGDNLWRGPVTLASSSTVDAFADSRVTLLGAIDDGPNASANGSDLTKVDTGEVALGGNNSYRGTTFVNQGILTVENNSGLGSPSNGTVVAAGGQLQVQGGVTIAAEPLIIQGTGGLQDDVQTVAIGGAQTGTFTLTFAGKTTASLAFNSTAVQVKTALNALSTIGGVGGSVNVYQPNPDVYSVVFMGSFAGLVQPLLQGGGTTNGTSTVVSKQVAGGSAFLTLPTWFNIGPAPINNGQSATNTMPVAGRVTSVTTDPSNPSIIYIATAGGGAWKTINDGQSWVPLFDGISAVQSATIVGSGNTSFTLTFAAQTTSALPGNATADQIQTALNSLSSIGGVGGYVTVTQTGNVFTINFGGGSLAGVNVPVLSASGSATVTIAVVKNGVSSQTALFTGAIAIAPSSPNIIYLGTGESDNSADSFYGSGVYESTNYGQTWTLLIDSKLGNPLFGQTISTIVVDPYQPNVIYLASGSVGSNAPSTAGTAGIWRYDGSTWFDLTGTASTVRQTQLGANPSPPIPPNPPGSTAPPNTTPMERNPPLTPGPDDDYRVSFPQTKATWSDLVLVYEDTAALPAGENGGPIAWDQAKGPLAPTDTAPTGTAYSAVPGLAQGSSVAVPVLYAALGTGAGSGSNGVFWCPNPQTTTKTLPPDWYLGNPYVAGKPTAGGAATVQLAPDIENTGSFPTGGGTIKLTSFISPNPGYPAKPLYPAFNQVTLFAAVTSPNSNGLSQIYTTVTGGFTWSALSNPPQVNMPSVPPTNYLGNAGNYNNTILAVSATTVFVGGQLDQGISNAGAIYPNPLLPGQANPYELSGTAANTGEIYETMDGGVNWFDITTDFAGTLANGPHDAQHAMSLDANGRLLVGTDGGVWRFDPATGLWSDLNGNLANDLVVAAAVDPVDPNNAFAGVTENGTAQFTGSPAADFADPLGASGGDAAINPLNPSIVYHVVNSTSGMQLRESTAGGASNSWTTILSEPLPLAQQPTLGLGGFFPLVLDSVNPSRLLMGGVRYQIPSPGLPPTGPVYLPASPNWENGTPGNNDFSLEESLDGGATWTNLSPNQDSQGSVGATTTQLPFDFTVTQVAIATNQGTFKADTGFPNVADMGVNTYDPNTIYVTGFSEVTGTPALFVTKDHGKTWLQRNTGLPASGFSVSGSITVDPRNRDTIYYTVPTAAGSGVARVFVSTNAGQTWSAAGTGLPDVPTWSLVVDPRSGNLYVGNDEGVYVSTNQGGTWQRFGVGMPEVQVRDLVLNQNLNTLTAATYGRSMFQLFLDNTQSNAGAITALTGSNVWTGPIALTGSSPGAVVQIGAGGSQVLQNGITTGQLILSGPISDLTQGGDYQLVKIGQGDVSLGGANTYGGQTQVAVGNLITQNSTALGNAAAPEIQTVGVSGKAGSFSLGFNGETTSPLTYVPEMESILLGGTNGTVALTFNGQTTGALSYQPEVETILVAGTAGTFTLTFNGQTTGALAFTAPASAVQSALNALSTIGGVGGSVNVSQSGELYIVSFGGTLAGHQQQITATGSGGVTATAATALSTGFLPDVQSVLPGGTTSGTFTLAFNGQTTGALSFQPEVQTVFVGGAAAGTFTLTFNGQTTVPLAFNAAASTVQFALNSLSSIGGVGGSVSVSQSGTQYTISFGGALAPHQSQITGTGSGGPTLAVNTVSNTVFLPAVQSVKVTGSPTGSFTLSFNGQTTGALPFTAPASAVQSALDSLSSIGGVGGFVNVNLSSNSTSNAYTISFSGTLAGLNEPAMTATGLAGTTAAVSIVTVGAGTGSIAFQSALNSLSSIGGVGGLVSVSQAGNLYNVSFGGTLAGLSEPAMTAATVSGGATAAVSTVTNGGGSGAPVVQSALNGLSSIGGQGGSVIVTQAGNLYNVSFGGTLSGHQPQITGTTSGGTTVVTNTVPNTVSLPEVQLVQLGGATTGTFALAFNGQTTGALPFTASASAVQSALNNLSTIGTVGGSVNVSLSTNATSSTYTITFGGSLIGHQPQMTATVAGSTAATVSIVTDGATGAAAIKDAIPQVQNVQLGGMGGSFTLGFNGQTTPALGYVPEVETVLLGGTTGTFTLGFNGQTTGALGYIPETETVLLGGVTTGTFTLTFNGQTTAALAFNASAATVQSALNGLSSIAGVGGSVSVSQTGNLFDVIFGGTLAGHQPQITGTGLGGTTVVANTVLNTVYLPEVQNVQVAGATSGSFNLTFNGQTTAALAFTSPASAVQSALNSLSSIGTLGGSVNVSLSSSSAGNAYIVTFGGALAGLNEPAMTATGSGGTTAAVSVTTVGATGAMVVQNALNALSTIGGAGGSVSVTQSGNLLNVSFGGALAGHQSQITATPSSGTTAVASTVPNTVFVPEVQSVQVGGATSGSFTLSFNGQTTGALLFNAPASAVQSALNNLFSIGGVGGSVNVSLANNTYTVTFGGSLIGHQPLMTATGLSGTTATVSLTTDGATGPQVVQNALNALSTIGGVGGSVNVTQTGSLFAVTFGGSLGGPQPPMIVTPTSGTTASVSTSSVTVVQTGSVPSSNFSVIFGGNLGNTHVPQITSTAIGTTVSTSIVVDGGVGTLVDPGAALELASNLQNEAITLQGDGISIDGHNTGALRNIAGNNTFTGTLTLSTSSNPVANVTIGVNSGTQLTIGTSPILSGTGTITDGALKVNLTKELTGTLILADADTYHGSTVVNQGALQIQNATSLGVTTTGGTTVLDGAQLQIQTPTSGPLKGVSVIVENQSLSLTGSGIFGTGALLDMGNNTWSGPITLASNPGFAPTTTPPNAVTFAVPSATDTFTVGGQISGATNLGLTKIGAGKLLLTQNDSYGGGTLINAGSVRIQGGMSLGNSGTATVVSNGAALELDGDPTATGKSISVSGGQMLTLNGTGLTGAGSLVNVSGNNTWTGAITLNSSNPPGIPSTYVDAIGINSGTSLNVTAGITGVTTATLTKLGAGTLFLSGINTYLGLTQIQAGIVNIGTSSALGGNANEQQVLLLGGAQNGSFTLTFNGRTTPALPFTAPNTAVQTALDNLTSIGGIGGSVTVTGGPTTGSSQYLVTFGGTLASMNVPAIVSQGFNGTTAVVTTKIDGGGLGTIVATGAALQLQGNISVSGEALTLSGNGVNSGGAMENVAGSNIWSGIITLGSSVTLGADGTSTLIINKQLTDGGNGFGVTKVGSGTLQFAGSTSNAYTGQTNVNLGTLQLNQTSTGAPPIAIQGSLTIGTGTSTPANPASAVVQLLASNQLGGTASVTINDGTFDLGNQSQTIGVLAMTGGIVSLTGAASNLVLSPIVTGNTVTASPGIGGTPAVITGAGTLSLGGSAGSGVPRTFTVNGSANATPSMIISAVIADIPLAAGLTKVGSGTLSLRNDNTYTGPTTVTQGILLADGPNPASTIGPVILNGGTLGGKGTVGTITAAASGTVAPGDGATSPAVLASATTSLIGSNIFLLTLTGPSAGQFSQLAVNGNINLGSATLAAQTVTGSIPPGTQIPIITTTGGNVAGVFANAPQGAIITLGGQKFGVNYTTNQVILTAAPKNSANIALVSSANPSVFGQDVTFTATVTPVTPGTGPIPTSDTVTFTLDGTALVPDVKINSSGQATLDLASLSPPQQLTVAGSPHSLSATFNGDGNWNTATTSLSQTVNMASTTVTFTTSPASAVIGQSLNVIATVNPVSPGAGVPTGTVTFTEDGVVQSPTTMTAGKATFIIASLAGPHTFQATYNGDVNFSASPASAVFHVSVPTATTISIASSAISPSVFGQPAITATVTPSSGTAKPTGGTVTFVVNGTSFQVPLTSANPGVAALPPADLPVGTNSVTASYSGDTSSSDNFLPSGPTSPFSQTVNKASTTTAIGSSSSTSVSGQPVTFTATVTGNFPSILKPTDGSVTFVIDGVTTVVPLTSANPGIATVTQSFLATTTTHTVSASYGGGASFLSSGPVSLTQTVNKAATTVTLGSSLNPSIIGNAVTFTAVVSGTTPSTGKPIDGSVTFVIDGASHTVALSSANPGLATFTITFTTAGPHIVTASYSGGTSYLANTVIPSLTQTVNQSANSTPTSLGAATTTTPSVGNPFGIKVTALNNLGKVVNTFSGPATISVISVPTGGHLTGSFTTTFSAGVATFSNLLIDTAGTYTVLISGAGLKATFTFSSFGRRTGF